MESNTLIPIKKRSLETLFSESLTEVPIVDIDEGRDAFIATEMCAQYLESAIDSIVIRDSSNNPIGIIGGYDILDNLRKNPHSDFFHETKVEDIMFKEVPIINKSTTIEELVDKWTKSKRAFALLPNEDGDYSPISARRMLELGMRCKTDMTISSIPKKSTITFEQTDSLDKILDSMFENKTRKLLLKESNKFISDRIILEGISIMLKACQDLDEILDIPASKFTLERAEKIKSDIEFDHFCSILNKMEHPYAVYSDSVISPWDVCTTLLSNEITEIYDEYQKDMACPHCGKNID